MEFTKFQTGIFVEWKAPPTIFRVVTGEEPCVTTPKAAAKLTRAFAAHCKKDMLE